MKILILLLCLFLTGCSNAVSEETTVPTTAPRPVAPAPEEEEEGT